MAKNDLRTEAIVLRRTKYGETDRILNLITPQGRLSVIAKGARKEKSKLAGGIEMFCVSEITAHFKSDSSDALGILTSARLQGFYSGIMSDLDRLELASRMLKNVAKLSDQIDSPELYTLTKSCLAALHQNQNQKLTEAWFLLNLSRISGEQINLHFDTNGQKLQNELKYSWNELEKSFSPHERGDIESNHIKLLRLMVTADLPTILRIKDADALIDSVLYIAKSCYN
ncbi:DNA repair protein RecO [Candidatus Saccharibacteria bacterium]|nr:DNA repair protein RecO [Candidatus Saccharibacteria bacterium]